MKSETTDPITMQDLSQSFLETVEKISKEVAHLPGLYQVGEVWRTPEWDFFARTLTLELAATHALQALLWKDQFLYEYGFQILSPLKIETKIRFNAKKMLKQYIPGKLLDSGKISLRGQSYQICTSVHSPGNADFILVVVFLSEGKKNLDSWKRVSQLLESFGYVYGKKDRRFVPLFDEFSESFLRQIQKKFASGYEYGVVTHFYIQNLEKYFRAMGFQKSFEILKTVQSIFGSYVKNEDIFVHQDTRSYYVFSPQCRKEMVLKRFEQVFLQVHHLIVDYRMRFWEIHPDTDLRKEWVEFLESENQGVF